MIIMKMIKKICLVVTLMMLAVLSTDKNADAKSVSKKERAIIAKSFDIGYCNKHDVFYLKKFKKNKTMKKYFSNNAYQFKKHCTIKINGKEPEENLACYYKARLAGNCKCKNIIFDSLTGTGNVNIKLKPGKNKISVIPCLMTKNMDKVFNCKPIIKTVTTYKKFLFETPGDNANSIIYYSEYGDFCRDVSSETTNEWRDRTVIFIDKATNFDGNVKLTFTYDFDKYLPNIKKLKNSNDPIFMFEIAPQIEKIQNLIKEGKISSKAVFTSKVYKIKANQKTRFMMDMKDLNKNLYDSLNNAFKEAGVTIDQQNNFATYCPPTVRMEVTSGKDKFVRNYVPELGEEKIFYNTTGVKCDTTYKLRSKEWGTFVSSKK